VSYDHAKEILKDLVAFPTVPWTQTKDIAGYISKFLADLGGVSELVGNEETQQYNLYATIGPNIDGGVALCGHMDVVVADPKDWTVDPFTLDERDGKLFGRGSVDMKGFLALSLSQVAELAKRKDQLKRPIHIAFTYDEEVGSFGADILSTHMSKFPVKPAMMIVGEPTDMKPIVAHKAGYEMETIIKGHACHSSVPRNGVNSIVYAMKIIAFMYELNKEFAANPHEGSPFDPPYTTINVGKIEGGEAPNVLAAECKFFWEFRPMPGDDGEAILQRIKDYVANVLEPEMSQDFSDTSIEIITHAAVLPLNMEDGSKSLELVSNLWGSNDHGVVAFGTDAGYFQRYGISTVVFGPGSISDAHKPDEFISIADFKQGVNFMNRLGDWACS
jgi:acetylornithine deacetylase